MSGLCWWMVDRLSRGLEAEERDAVRGDFAELGLTGGPAVRELLGLLARRQAALWIDWRPWLTLVAMVAPLGVLLSLLCQHVAELSAVYVWLYVNNWTWGYLESPGARLDLAEFTAGFLLNAFTLMCWSWTSGFVLASLSRRTSRLQGALFCLVLAGALSAIPQPADAASAVFSLTFYRVVFPLILVTGLAVLPLLAGMHQGLTLATLPVRQTMLWAVAIAILTVRSTRSVEGSAFGWGIRLQATSPLGLLLPLALTMPIGYMVATASWQHWHRGASPTSVDLRR